MTHPDTTRPPMSETVKTPSAEKVAAYKHELQMSGFGYGLKAATVKHIGLRLIATIADLEAKLAASEAEREDKGVILVGMAKRLEKAERDLAQSREAESIGREILAIMEEYDRQYARNKGYVDTPGGLEHMGDVWRLLDSWRDRLTTGSAP